VETESQIHDFLHKLRQRSSVSRLRQYVSWQRQLRAAGGDIRAVPSLDLPLLSVNLDLSTACNHACRFCVDAEVLNSGKTLSCEEILSTIDILAEQGLRSIILIGGGEPTLHRDFARAVHGIKDRGLQLGIVTNGTRPERILEAADRFAARDWIRFSLDAGTDATYQMIHNPHGKGNTLESVLRSVRNIKACAPSVTVGYSFVVCWNGLVFDGVPLPDNINEIPLTAEMAAEYGFDYLSLKPCLVKDPGNPVETLALKEDADSLLEICRRLRQRIDEARERVDGQLKIYLSVNLIAMLEDRLEEMRQQPETCHIGFFRQVISPLGVYHCPAFRGDPIARVADRTGYASSDDAERSRVATARRLLDYDAHQGCRNIACIYNGVNRAIEELIAGKNPPDLEDVPDEEFFL
jgi:MoaA/NifB/PqqE/SkfB family radical SAM enzyme